MLLVVFASGYVGPVGAQQATPTKVLCSGEPPTSLNPGSPPSCTAATSPVITAPVYYTITLTPSQTGSFSFLETLPPTFQLSGVSCTNPSGNGSGPVYPVTATMMNSGVTFIGPLSVQFNNVLYCFVSGSFSTPGACGVNNLAVGDTGGTPVSSSFQLPTCVSPQVTVPSDISVTKQVSWPGMPAPLDVSISPQTVHYKITVKNNGPQDVYLGQTFELHDVVSSATSGVPVQTQIVASSISCTPSPSGGSIPPNAACFGAPNALPGWNTALYNPNPLNLATWHFPTSGLYASGFLPASGTMVIEYDVQVRPIPNLFCSRGGEALHNEAFAAFNGQSGTNFPDPNPGNNTVTTPDVPILTGQPNDPDCAIDTQGPIKITKVQLPPTSPIAWNTGVANYRITVTNTDPSPITIRLRDRVAPYWGTPNLKATVTTSSCVVLPSSPCPTPTTSAPIATSYMVEYTVWNDNSIVVPGAVGSSPGTVQLLISIRYDRLSCDTYANGNDTILNIGRADYHYNGANYTISQQVPTAMQPSPACHVNVSKDVIGTDKVVFDPSSGDSISYKMNFKNLENFPISIGTLFDAVRIQQSNYATHLDYYNSSASCQVTSGAVSNAPSGGINLSGTIYYTPYPSQGTKIFQNNGVVTFGANSTLSCVVHLKIHRPVSGDPYCLSSVEPRLENLALMDVSYIYNPSVPFPPSGTYNPNITPVTTPQPPVSGTSSWRMADARLPKCYKLTASKASTPTFSWTPGGPALNYTITYTNYGDTLSGGTFNNGVWTGFQFGDAFAPAIFGGVQPGMHNLQVTSSCTSPAATWTPVNSSALMDLLTTFPGSQNGQPCKITATFTIDPPPQSGQVCNTTFIGLSNHPGQPTDTEDWYANVPDPALLNVQYCIPVLPTTTVDIKKILDNQAAADLPSELSFPMTTVCTTPNPTPGALPPFLTSTYQTHGPADDVQEILHVPVSSTCVVTEDTSQLPVLTDGHSKCAYPSYPAWQIPPTYNPGQSVTVGASGATIAVLNVIKCVMPPVNVLTVNKVVQPAWALPLLPSTTQFPVHVTCGPIGHALNLAVNSSTPINNVPVGTQCSAEEGQPSYTPPHCTWSKSIAPASIVIPAQGQPTITITNTLSCQPDLAVTKTGPVPTGTPGLYGFTITVTNPGGSFTPPLGSLTVSDTVFGSSGTMAGITTTSPGWTCPGASCTYTGGPIGSGQVVGIFTAYYYAWTPGPYVNCANVTLSPHPGAVDWNSDNDNFCVPHGTQGHQVDLKVVKTGPTPVPGQPGVSQFTVTIFNNGAPVFLPAGADFVVHDLGTGMPGGIMNISMNSSYSGGSWSCPYSGASANCTYTVASGGMTVPTGAIGTLVIFYHPTTLQNFTNCASVDLLPNAGLIDIFPPNNKSCVHVSSFKIIDHKVIDNTLHVVPPAGTRPPSCDPATTLARGDACVCRYESMNRLSAEACGCRVGSTLVAGRGCVAIEQCKPPMFPDRTGRCGCPDGTTLRNGTCVKIEQCKPPLVPDKAGRCQCPEGTTLRNGTCVKVEQCKPPMVSDRTGRCECPDGTTLRNGACVKVQQCKPPMVPDAAGRCGCPEGLVFDGKQCVKRERGGQDSNRSDRHGSEPAVEERRRR